MALLAWNVRGLGNKDTVRALKNICFKHKNDIVFLSETKQKRRYLEKIRMRMKMDNAFYVDPGPGLYSDIKKKARAIFLYIFKLCHAITSTGTKKGELLLAYVNTQVKNKNITTNVKFDTKSNLFTTVTIDEPAPGLKTIFSFVVPDQKSGKVIETFLLL
ncbi:hypothetical protein GQ457_15G009130 [Hibiscus cannabinus]